MVVDLFPVVEVVAEAAEAVEAMGTKQKFWYANYRRLFKVARPSTGEDWSEKIASELCDLLVLPHAYYDLATWKGIRGTVSASFLPMQGRLVHGNELLLAVISGYPDPAHGKRYRQSQHTLEAILKVIADPAIMLPTGWQVPAGISSAPELFCGYLMLDAFIGNTDRHEENWGCVELIEMRLPPARSNEFELRVRHREHSGQSGVRRDMMSPVEERVLVRYLSPTFDHASCLGRELTDENRSERLTTRDSNRSVEAYAERTRSAIYRQPDDSKPMTPYDAFGEMAKRFPDAARIWLNCLSNISDDMIESLFNRIPADRISAVAAEFAMRLLHINRISLLNIRLT
jgi:hypothetical protein